MGKYYLSSEKRPRERWKAAAMGSVTSKEAVWLRGLCGFPLKCDTMERCNLPGTEEYFS